MKTLAERLQFVMSKNGITQQKLADLIGITQQSVNKIVKGDTLNPKNIVEIANALGVDVQWLRSGEGTAPDFADFSQDLTRCDEDDEDKIQFNVVDVYASGGHGCYNSTDMVEVVSLIEFNRDFVQQVFRGVNLDHVNIINVKGDSMEPTLASGDLIYVDSRIRHYDGDGIYVFVYDDALMVKRVQKTGSYLTIIPDNKAYDKWTITEENEALFHIVGKVLVGQSQKMKMFG